MGFGERGGAAERGRGCARVRGRRPRACAGEARPWRVGRRGGQRGRPSLCQVGARAAGLTREPGEERSARFRGVGAAGAGSPVRRRSSWMPRAPQTASPLLSGRRPPPPRWPSPRPEPAPVSWFSILPLFSTLIWEAACGAWCLGAQFCGSLGGVPRCPHRPAAGSRCEPQMEEAQPRPQDPQR